MFNDMKGSFRLLRLAGIDVYLHWSWFLVAVYEIQGQGTRYTSIVWNVLEYLALFLIVVVHEFGHSLACRSVGGTANRILLWPLGGAAFVSPPQRPGATLWSIVAGPLVNLVLLPVFWSAFAFARTHGWAHVALNEYLFLRALLTIDIVLLIFNLLPIYPLDGGQILRSLLWFVFGRGRSLMIVTVLGFAGVAAVIAFAVWTRSVWTFAMALFMLLSCWGGLKHARSILRAGRLPRRPGFACPACHNAPPIGPFWGCAKCGKGFDTFETGGVCPHCGAEFDSTSCLDCEQSRPLLEWTTGNASLPDVSPSVVARGDLTQHQ
jgi:Zn-dependent protease